MVTSVPLRILLLAGLLTFNRPALAQSNPKDFFEPNYAKDDFKNGARSPNGTRPRQAPQQPAAALTPARNKSETELRTEAAILKLRESGTLSGSGRSAQKQVLPGAPLGAVTAVGALLNGGDPQHARRYFKELLDLTREPRIAAGKVYITFGIQNLDVQDMWLWQLRGGKIGVYLKELPKKYEQISNSPTWILYTKDGEVLIEGADSPSRYITADGKVIEPVTPTPTPIVAGGESLLAETPAAKPTPAVPLGF